MDCDNFQERLSACLDRELTPAEMADCTAHIAGCEACDASYRRLADLRMMVAGQAESHAAPAALRSRIMADIAAQAQAPGKIGLPAKKSKGFNPFGAIAAWPWARINFGVATVCAAALAVNLTLDMHKPSETDFLDQEIVSAHFRSLQADHLADVASSDHHTVKPWFSGKLDYSPPVVDLTPQDFPLIGGRLDYVHQRSVAGLAYRHGKHLINLFVWPNPAQQNAPAKMTTDNGFQLLRWSRDGMSYTAISDMNGAELETFRQLLMAEIEKEKQAS